MARIENCYIEEIEDTKPKLTRERALEIVNTMLTQDDLEELDARIQSYAETRDDEIAGYGSSDMGELDRVGAFIDLASYADEIATSKFETPETRAAARADAKRYLKVLIALHVRRDQRGGVPQRRTQRHQRPHVPLPEGGRQTV